MKSTAIIAGAAFALGLLAALAWSLWSRSTSATAGGSDATSGNLVSQPEPRAGAHPAAGSETQSTLASANQTTAADRATAPAPETPLPPIDTPLAGVLSELERRARAGDGPAACRLAAELSRCATLDARRQSRRLFDPVETSTSQISEIAITHAARLDLALETDERICAGVAPERSRNALPWLYEAARLGNPAAMSAFARARWWHDGSAIHHPQIIERYRAEAGAMAEGAIAAGDQSMAAYLGIALAGAQNFPGASPILNAVVEPDPVRARALLLIGVGSPIGTMIKIGSVGATPINPIQRQLDLLTASLDVAQLADSDAQAARLRATMPAPTELRTQQNPLGGGNLVEAKDCAR